MMSIPIKYKYAMNVKLSAIGSTPVNLLFPNIEDLVLGSKLFDEFDLAVASVNGFVSELTETLNTSVKLDKYKMISEISPRFSGQETISKDWGPNEIAKLWIVDKNRQEAAKGPIPAVALAQLLEISGDPVQQH